MATFLQFVYRGVRKMATYILVDTANTFFRARHVVRGDIDTKVGMAMHITLNSVKKAWQDFNGTHVVFCLEGRSWRKDFYLPYKRNRQVARDKMTVVESEEDTVFWEIFDEFKNFVSDKTNCTVMRHRQLEADDLIAGWVQAHPNDKHVIISTDGDFAQLIAPNCTQYSGIQDLTITHEGYFDKKGNHVIDKKTKEAKPAPDPDFMLFEKCMRGTKGYNWNNMMLQRWTDHEGEEHRVLDDYNRNVVLCDLTAQPADIRAIIDETINEATENPKEIAQVGMRLMKFCAKWDMQRIADQAQYYAEPLQARYIK